MLRALKQRCTDEEEFRILINELDDSGVSLIHYVAALDYSDMVGFLHEMGANLNIKAFGTNYSPLVIAAARGYDLTVRNLMKHGAHILQKPDDTVQHVNT